MGVSAWEVAVVCPGGDVCLGGCLPRGMSVWGEGCLPRGCIPACNVNRLTDRCKNIILSQTSFAGGKNRNIAWYNAAYCQDAFVIISSNIFSMIPKLYIFSQSNQIRFVDIHITKLTLTYNIAISVVGIYYLLYLPGIVNAFVDFSWKAYVNHVTLVLLSCNGIASPLIYVWRSETFRHYISVMFGFRAPDGAARRSVSVGSNRPDCP